MADDDVCPFVYTLDLSGLRVPHDANLGLREVRDLVLGGVQVRLPRGEQAVQRAPVLLGERAVHGGGDVDHGVGLVQLRADQLRLQHCNEEEKKKEV